MGSVTRAAPVEETCRRRGGRSKSGFTDGFSVEIFFDPIPSRGCRDAAGDYTAPRRTAEMCPHPDSDSLTSGVLHRLRRARRSSALRGFRTARARGNPEFHFDSEEAAPTSSRQHRLRVGSGPSIAEERHLSRGHDRDAPRRVDVELPASRGRSSSAEFVGGRASTVNVSAESRSEVPDLATRMLETARADTVRCQPEVSPT